MATMGWMRMRNSQEYNARISNTTSSVLSDGYDVLRLVSHTLLSLSLSRLTCSVNFLDLKACMLVIFVICADVSKPFCLPSRKLYV